MVDNICRKSASERIVGGAPAPEAEELNNECSKVMKKYFADALNVLYIVAKMIIPKKFEQQPKFCGTL
jgi:hypothetical protein